MGLVGFGAEEVDVDEDVVSLVDMLHCAISFAISSLSIS